jgi:putative membrane protein
MIGRWLTMYWGLMGMGGFGWFFMVFFWIALIAIVFWLAGRCREPEKSGGGRALEILSERYAKGEITKEKMEEMKKDIGL